MVTLHNDAVLLRSKHLTDVTVNATAMYKLDTETNLYDVIAIIRGKVGELSGDIEIRPILNLPDEETAQVVCKQFVQDAFYMSRNQPNKYQAFLKGVETIARHLPQDTSAMEGIFILFSIPVKYLKHDNVFTYRN